MLTYNSSHLFLRLISMYTHAFWSKFFVVISDVALTSVYTIGSKFQNQFLSISKPTVRKSVVRWQYQLQPVWSKLVNRRNEHSRTLCKTGQNNFWSIKKASSSCRKNISDVNMSEFVSCARLKWLWPWNASRKKLKLYATLVSTTRVRGGVSGGTSCLYLHAISSRPKVGVYIPVTLKFWPWGTIPPSPPHAHVWCQLSNRLI